MAASVCGSDGRRLAERQRRESEGRRALEIARHQEAAGRQGRERIALVARGAEIGGEELAASRAVSSLCGRGRIETRR